MNMKLQGGHITNTHAQLIYLIHASGENIGHLWTRGH